MNSTVLTDLRNQPDGAHLCLPDADLRFWHQTNLGQSYDHLLEELITVTHWRHQQITVYGKSYMQPRLTAWHGDVGYRYSGIRLSPRPWTKRLTQLQGVIENITGLHFNSVLLNFYRNNNDSMGMHSDDERELGPQPAIASLSLGATRSLLLKHKTRKDLKTFKLDLTPGSLLVMRGDTQRYWRHGINKTKQNCGPRINLTFRQVIPLSR